MKQNRIKCIDIAKGIAIFTVCCAHLAGGWGYLTLVKTFIPFFMGMFFLISGYFYKPGKGYWYNVKKRVRQVLLPFLLYGAIVILIAWIFETLRGNPIALTECLEAYGRMIIDNDAFTSYTSSGSAFTTMKIMVLPLWFLSRLFFSELIFFAIADFALKSRKNTCISCLGLLSVTFLLQTFVPVHLIFQLEICFAIAALMVVAAAANQYHAAVYIETEYRTRNYWLILGAVIALYIAFFLTDSGGTMIAKGIYSSDMTVRPWQVYTWFGTTVTGTCWFLVICTFIAKIKYLDQILIQLGRRSLVILSFHYLVGYIFARLVGFSTLYYFGQVPDNTEGIVTVLVSITVCIGIDLGIGAVKKKFLTARRA